MVQFGFIQYMPNCNKRCIQYLITSTYTNITRCNGYLQISISVSYLINIAAVFFPQSN